MYHAYKYSTIDEIVALQVKLSKLRWEHWLNHDLFRPQWWVLGFILVVPWIVWWRLLKRERIKDITLYGCLLIIVVMILDHLGIVLGLWAYDYQFIPIHPGLDPVDLSAIPVTHMLIYQYFRNWKAFIYANLAMGIIFSFVAEPLLFWMGIYKLYHWTPLYSLPIYLLKDVSIGGSSRKYYLNKDCLLPEQVVGLPLQILYKLTTMEW